MYVVYRHSCKQNIHTHKILKILEKIEKDKGKITVTVLNKELKIDHSFIIVCLRTEAMASHMQGKHSHTELHLTSETMFPNRQTCSEN